ncbi:MAG: sugar transferase [Lachnospiraceae bacterium]
MYRKIPNGWVKHIDFLFLDIACVVISYIVAYMIRHEGIMPFVTTVYKNMLVMFMMLSFAVPMFLNTYQGVLKRGYLQEFKKTLHHVMLVMLLGMAYLVFAQEAGNYSRFTLIVMSSIYLSLSYATRVGWKKVLLARRNREDRQRSLVIVTTKELVERVVENVQNNNYEGFYITGIAVVDESMIGQEIAGIKVVADYESIIPYVSRAWVDEVFINIPSTNVISEQLIEEFAKMGVTVHLRLIHASQLMPNRQVIEKIGKYTVLTTSVVTTTMGQVILKRLLDVVSGIIGCLITIVLAALIGPMIYAQSPGPIFFSQTRIGKNGRKFDMYKFRSMYMDAEERKAQLMSQNQVKDGMMFKLEYDPRIIGSERGKGKGIGNFIRKYSLDEFPQFFNVLKGEMSLVGTRPPTIDEWEKYELHHRARLATKPGITGMWQVSGRSNIRDFEEVVRLDTKYITDWKFSLDLKILFRTVWMVLKRDGAM